MIYLQSGIVPITNAGKLSGKQPKQQLDYVKKPREETGLNKAQYNPTTTKLKTKCK